MPGFFLNAFLASLASPYEADTPVVFISWMLNLKVKAVK